MKVPSVDYAPLFAASSAKFGAKQAAISAEQSKLVPESLRLKQKAQDLSTASIVVGSVLEGAGLALNAIQTFKDIKDTADLEDSKNNILSTKTEYGEMALEAILNGTTVVTYENGKADVKLSPELEAYKQAKLNEIETSKKSKEVKAYEKQNLMSLFASEDNAVMQNAATKHINDINTAYEMNYDISLKADIQAKEGYAAGQALISSRTDISQAQRQAALYAYQKEVDYGRADAMATTIAKADGVGKAIEYAYSLTGFSQAQVQTMVSNASKASQALTASAQQAAQETMRTGLESGATPSTLYRQIENATADMPTERKNAAMDIARAQHIEWANAQSADNLAADQSLSYDNLKAQRESIDKGERSYIYDGIPSTKAALLAKYDDTLSKMEESGQKEYSQVVVDNINATVASFKLGKISGMDAVTEIAYYTKDNPVVVMQKIDEVVSEVIPENMKPFADDFVKNTLPAIMMKRFKADKESELSAEQRNAITSAQMFASGQFLDLAMESKDLNQSQFTEAMANITRIYTAKEMDAISTGTVMEDTSGTFNNAMKMLDTFATVDPVTIDYKGKTTWATPAMEATFDQASLALGVELGKRGITIDSYMPMPIFDGNGKPVDAIAKPVFTSDSGYYTFDKDNLMVSDDMINWRYAPKQEQTQKTPAIEPISQTPIQQEVSAGARFLGAMTPQPKTQPAPIGEPDDISGAAPTVAKATEKVDFTKGTELTNQQALDAFVQNAKPIQIPDEKQEEVSGLDSRNAITRDNRILAKFTEAQHNIVKSYVEKFMKANEGVVPTAATVGNTRMNWFTDDIVGAIYRKLLRERQN